MASDALRGWQLAARGVLVFVVFPLVAIGVTHLVPNTAVLDQLVDDRASGLIGRAETPVVRAGGTSDRFGECVLVTVGIREPGEGWLGSIAASPNLGRCQTVDDRLAQYEDDGTIVTNDKVRYWNGLSAVARPVLWVSGIATLRLLGALTLAASIVYLARAGTLVAGRLGGAALVVPIGATADLVGLVDVFHHPMMLAVGLFGVGVLLSAAARGDGGSQLAVVAAGAGAVYSFFDLFNFVPGVWLLCTGVVIAALPVGVSSRARVRAGAMTGIGWLVGYGGMWLSAWLFAALATSPNAVWDSVTGQLEMRVNGESAHSTGDAGAGARAVMRHWLDRPGAPAIVGCLLLAGLLGLASARHRRAARSLVLLASAPLLVMIPWLLVMNNHHEIHFWFEYRSLPMLASVPLFAIAVARTDRFFADDPVAS